MAKEPIVIIGGGRAAASLIDAYREAGGDALITRRSRRTSTRRTTGRRSRRGSCAARWSRDEALVHTAEEYDDLAVELRLETTVESVDTDGAHGYSSQAARRSPTARS